MSGTEVTQRCIVTSPDWWGRRPGELRGCVRGGRLWLWSYRFPDGSRGCMSYRMGDGSTPRCEVS